MNMQVSQSAIAAAAPINSAYVLSSKAMLASLTITQWTARKLDKRVTAATNAAHNAAATAGNYNKALIAGEALAKIVTAANAARAIHYERTLPWAQSGAGILPAAGYVEYMRLMRGCKESSEAAAAEFVANYPQYIEDAKRRLGDMFNAADYPHVDAIARKFSFSVDIYQVPAAGDFRAQLAEDEIAAIRAQMEIKTQDALAAAMRNVFERIAETVGKMAEKLAAYQPAKDGQKAKGIFRDSLTENVESLAAILPSLNLTNDPILAGIIRRMENELCNVDAETLRESEIARAKLRDIAADIVDKVSEFI